MPRPDAWPVDKIGEHFVVAPGADAGALVGRDVEGMPSGRHRAGEFFAVVEREAEIARRMAFAAMRQRFGDIGAAVPLRGFAPCWARSALLALKKQRPEDHRPALIEREAQRVRAIARHGPEARLNK